METAVQGSVWRKARRPVYIVVGGITGGLTGWLLSAGFAGANFGLVVGGIAGALFLAITSK